MNGLLKCTRSCCLGACEMPISIYIQSVNIAALFRICSIIEFVCWCFMIVCESECVCVKGDGNVIIIFKSKLIFLFLINFQRFLYQCLKNHTHNEENKENDSDYIVINIPIKLWGNVGGLLPSFVKYIDTSLE